MIIFTCRVWHVLFHNRRVHAVLLVMFCDWLLPLLQMLFKCCFPRCRWLLRLLSGGGQTLCCGLPRLQKQRLQSFARNQNSAEETRQEIQVVCFVDLVKHQFEVQPTCGAELGVPGWVHCVLLAVTAVCTAPGLSVGFGFNTIGCCSINNPDTPPENHH